MVLLKAKTPPIQPRKRGMRKSRCFFHSFMLRAESILSYIFKMTAIVPPLTPGMALDIPSRRPQLKVFKIPKGVCFSKFDSPL